MAATKPSTDDQTTADLLEENERLKCELAVARQQAAAAEESQRILDAILLSVPAAITIADAPDARIRWANERAQELAGRPLEAFRGVAVEQDPEAWGIYRADGVTPARTDELPLTRAIRAGESVLDEELVLRRPDDKRLHVLCSAGPIRDGAGGITGAVLAWWDITARREAEEALRASEEHLRTINATAPIGIFQMDATGSVTYVNPRWGEITGRMPEEGLGMRWVETVHPEERETALAAWASGVQNPREESTELRLLTPQGQVRWVCVHVAPLYGAGALAGWVGTLEDITERRRAEAALQAANDELRVYARIVEESPDFISAVDRQYVYRMVNPTYCRLNGVPADQLLGATPAQFGPEVFEEVIRPELDRCFSGESVCYEAWFDYAAAGRRYMEVRYYPLSVDHHVEYAVVIGRDITERKQFEDERERLLQQLQEASAAKDRFLAILSHELRNPLAPILAGVFILRQRVPEDERIRSTLDIIERNAKLQARLVDDLLDLSRISRGKMQFEQAPVALDAVVNAAVEDQRAEAEKAGLTLSVSAEPGLWVLGDFSRLQQAVLNLLTNAIKFTPAGGEIRVGVWECGGVGEWGSGGAAAPPQPRPPHPPQPQYTPPPPPPWENGRVGERKPTRCQAHPFPHSPILPLAPRPTRRLRSRASWWKTPASASSPPS